MVLGKTSTIVMTVILAAVLGAVAGPAVGWLERHRVPRVGGAVLVLQGSDSRVFPGFLRCNACCRSPGQETSSNRKRASGQI